VRLGSEAFYKGVIAGDRILQARASGNRYMVLIDRNGKTFNADLEQMGVPKLAAASPAPTANSHPAKWPLVDVNDPHRKVIQQQMLKLIACYDVVLLIDSSGSMHTPDCPQGLSRWEWCHQQATDLVASLKPYIKNGISIVTFNKAFDAYEHVNLDTINTIFDNIAPSGSTDLVDPLNYEFSQYFRSRSSKPLLVAIITDGLPNRPSADPRLLRNALIDCTMHMTDRRQIAVTFLQVGDFAGQQVVVDLDENLVSYGARYDIVDTKTFDELKAIGLPRALVDAVVESGSGKVKSSHSYAAASGGSMSDAFKMIEEQKRALEQQMLIRH
jgi:Mg-chelatase subunit ChlD